MKKIVIVGAGFAGLSALLVLLKNKIDSKAKITLIDKNDNFEYIPSIYLCLNNPKKIDKIRFSLKKHYSDFFVKANVKKITDKKVITDNNTFEFDYLILATGSVTNTFNNKSFEKNTYFAKNITHIQRINNDLEKAKNISLIGGGYTGVEIAAILADDFSKKINIIDEEKTLLRGLNESTKDAVKKVLEQKNISLYLGSRCKECLSDKIILESGKKIKSDMNILVAGIRPNSDILNDIPSNVNEFLQLENNYNIFVCGDLGKTILLPTAHNAMVEGRIAGHNLSELINKSDNFKEVKPVKTILGIALGNYLGVIPTNKSYLKSYSIGLIKLLVEKRCLFEFKRKIILPL